MLGVTFSAVDEKDIESIQPGQTRIEQIKLPEMVSIPGGEFWMGSSDDDKKAAGDEKPRHKVRVASFTLGKFEVTKVQFAAFVDDSRYRIASGCWTRNGLKWKNIADKSWRSPGFEQSGNDPVTCVSHKDALAYIDWINNKTGHTYRLPTEAEWEYVARAGTTDDYYWEVQKKAVDFAWFSENSRGKTHLVGQLKPNAFGLYDMSGNVLEWVGIAGMIITKVYRKMVLLGIKNKTAIVACVCCAAVPGTTSWRICVQPTAVLAHRASATMKSVFVSPRTKTLRFWLLPV